MRKALPLLAVLALTGCSGNAAPVETPTLSASATEASPTASTVGTVSGVAELQESYVAAGGTCSGDLEDLNKVRAAVASGSCPDSGTVLSTYVTHDDAAASAELTSTVSDRIGSTLILGDNWVINPGGDDKTRADELADTMGGQVIRREPTPVDSLDDAFTLEQAAQAYGTVDGARCDSPTEESDGAVLVCEDGAIIVDADDITETKDERRAAADELAEGIKAPGTPIVGRRHVVVVPISMDAATVARAIDATPPTGT